MTDDLATSVSSPLRIIEAALEVECSRSTDPALCIHDHRHDAEVALAALERDGYVLARFIEED